MTWEQLETLFGIKFKLEDGTFLIDIPEMMEIEQSINVQEMFK